LRWVGEAIHDYAFNDFDQAGLVDASDAGLEEHFRDADPFNVQVNLCQAFSVFLSEKTGWSIRT
jgi:hypothetical protein